MIIGTKDLPVIARTAGRLAGRAIGYVQLARGQFDNVMHKSQASQVLKFFSVLLLFIYLLIEHMVIGVKCVQCFGLAVQASLVIVLYLSECPIEMVLLSCALFSV